jgi:hypothetical protein
MRPSHQILAATGILILCSVLIIRQSGRTDRDPIAQNPENPTRTIKSVRQGPSGAERGGEAEAAAPSKETPETASTNIPPTSTVPQPESPPATPARGIQLADNVQLPAVILALNSALKDPNKKVPAPVAAAMQGIIDTFYQDLAVSVQNDPAIGGTEVSSTETDSTILIQPGPAVESARKRANETYRALFGDEAYGQMTMNALLESRLPVDSGERK